MNLTPIAGHVFEVRPSSSMKTKHTRGLPPVNPDGRQVAVVEPTFPPGMTSPKHAHPGFVLGYVLVGEFRFHIDGQGEAVLSVQDIFSEPPRCIHSPSGSASTTRPARILVLAIGKKRREITKRL